MWKDRKAKLRVARPTDLFSLLEMMRESRAARQMDLDIDAATPSVLELLRTPSRGRIWMLDCQGEIGYVIVRLYRNEVDREPRAFVDELYVHGEYSSPEIYAMVLEAVAGFCRERGVRAYHRKLGREYVVTKWL